MSESANSLPLLDILSSYMPALLTRRIAQNPAAPDAPHAERHIAAIMFADISGFTALTERLALQGAAGAEAVSSLLNAYFGQLIGQIVAHGGDVLKFAGDALLAFWPADSDSEDLATVIQRAAQCSLAVQNLLYNYEAIEGVRLSLRISIGAGEISTMRLGGIYGRWELLIAGPPLNQITVAVHQAQPGEVIMSAEAWAAAGGTLNGQVMPGGDARLGSVRTRLQLRPLTLPALLPNAEKALRAFIPGAILARLTAGQTDWLAELRRVTVLFLNLPDLNHTTPLDQAQEVMRALQTAMYHYEGSINKLSVDDKGISLVAALGLPPLAHEDDAARGIQAGLAMQSALRELGLRSAVGITTGRAFCGAIGGSQRHEYTMIGDVVNLSARLMQAAPGDLLCDAATYQAAQTRFRFEALPAITVKGKAEPLAVYRPHEELKASVSEHTPMIGRDAERKILAGHLERLLLGHAGSVVIIEGEAGIGKSRMVDYLLGQAQLAGIKSLIGWGDAVEKSTPYFPWRSVLNRLFNLDSVADDVAARRGHVLAQLQDTPNLLRLAPLLNAILPLDLPDDELTAQMTGQVRADNTRELLIGLLQRAASSPLLLVLEDAHWLDSASWGLARAVSRDVSSLLLVIATRPLVEPLPLDYRALSDPHNSERLPLFALPAQDALALVCQRLGVASLPEPVARLIQDKADGHPFFSEELAYALRDAGLIIIANGECQLAPDAGDLSALNLPDTVQGVITSRTDRLSPAQQLTLKTASVIGRVFAVRTLHDVYPVEADRARLGKYLADLAQLDLTPLDTPEPDLAYIFKHIITQEVAYNLMLFAQRRQLHRAVAVWYEQNHTDDLTPYYTLLAHHWGKAEDATKTIEYLAKAGEQALQRYANQEAVGFFDEALRLCGAPSNAMRRAQEARWQRQLGEAYWGLGQMAESRDHLLQSLALSDWPVPATRAGLVTGVVKNLFRQIMHRVRPAQFAGHMPAEARDAAMEAVRALDRLGQISFFESNMLYGSYAAFSGLNLAEAAGPSPELVRNYAYMRLATGMFGQRGLAEIYARHARETAQSVNDLATTGTMLTATGLYCVYAGQWAEARSTLEEAIEILNRLGDVRQWAESVSSLGLAAYYHGQFAEGEGLAADLYTLATRSANLVHQMWGINVQTMNMIRLGKVDEALTILENAAALYETNPERQAQAIYYGLRASAYLRQGKLGLARQMADAAQPLNAYAQVRGFAAYFGVTETYLALWETSTGSADERQTLRDLAHQSVKTLHSFTRPAPIAKPRAWLWQGLAHWLDSKLLDAHKAWLKSLAAAKELDMPYDEGLAHYEIGRHLDPSDPARQEQLKRAAQLFEQLGAAYDLQRTQAILTPR